jgi:capsule polysaccharide export protein KpsE/RkpR
MARDVDKPEQMHEEELELAEPLLSLEGQEDERKRREKSIARLRLLWKQRRLLMRAAGAGLVVTSLIAFLIPNRYSSTARLMPPDEQSSSGMALLAGLAGKAGPAVGQLGGQLLGLKTTGDLFIGILQSRTVEDELIREFDLRKLYGDKRWEDARKELGSRTSISSDRNSGIITISVQDRSPARAQQMAQEYVTELNRVVNDLNTSSAHRERVFLEERLGQVQQELEQAEKAFSQFASKNTAIDIQEQGKAMIEAGATLEGQLVAAQTELEGLRQIFTDNNVRVRETQARVDELRKQLQKIAGDGASTTSSSVPDSGALYPSIRKLPLLGVSYADLYRKTKVEEAVFETLTQEYELAKVQEAKETPSVKVLDAPDIPEKKSYPPRLFIICFGTILAGILGLAWVLTNKRWEATDPADPRKALAVEVWSDVRRALPWISTNGSGPDKTARRVDGKRNLSGASKVVGPREE